MDRFNLIALAAVPLLLAACGNETAAPDAGDTANDAPAIPSADSSPVAGDDGDDMAANEIPAAMRGRWGMVEADCDPARDDAKGLLEIDAANLTFYESRANVAEVVSSGNDNFRARYDFTGEGQNWEREIAFELEDDARTLTRRDFGEDAAAETYEYTRCS